MDFRGPGARGLALLGAGLAVALAGYVAGRADLAGALVRRLAPALAGSGEERARHGGRASADPAASDAYEQLHGFLDAELQRRRGESPVWRELLTLDDPAKRAAWTERRRSAFAAWLGGWPGPATDLDPRFELLGCRDGVRIARAELGSLPGVRLPALLLWPEAGPTPRAALLAIHGMYGSPESTVDPFDYHHGFGMELARRGLVVLAPLGLSSTTETRRSLNAKAMALGWNVHSLDLWQLGRALDLLLALEGVDPSRVAVYGVSLGGGHALRLGALDERVSLVVSSGHLADKFGWLFQRGHGSPNRPPDGHMIRSVSPDDAPHILPGLDLDDLNLVALIQPRALALVAGRRDPRHATAVAAFEQVKRIYARAGRAENVYFLEPPGGHEISLEHTWPVIDAWRSRHLPEAARGAGTAPVSLRSVLDAKCREMAS